MITTVTLNLAIDKTYYMASFEKNRVNRVNQMHIEPGGKGINVAKVLKTLNIPVTVTGFAGGYNGAFLSESMDLLQIEHEFVHVSGESRICLNVIDKQKNESTEILEKGPWINHEQWNQLKKTLDALASKSEYIVLSGSLPQGLTNRSYAELVKVIHAQGAKAVVDTSGAPFKEVLMAEPFLIKPNQEELAQIVGVDQISEDEVVHTLNKWRKFKIPIMIVTLGKDGAIVSANDKFYRVIPPPINVVNSVGSGDSFAAGFIAGLYSGNKIKHCLCMAAAAGAANALTKKAGSIALEEFERLKTSVKVFELS
ncbi:MAG TPA: 1-phosphofructokinase [Bacillales bacterium]|nr:1-phosphofructokinase [Bacillales bacterium]